jgi:hypothetical protein
MTLEQTTQRILLAVEAQDLEMLQAAAKERETAIASLSSIPPSPALHEAITASIAAGEEAKLAIRAIQQGIRKDSRRLANIEHGFLRAILPTVKRQIDCQG